jgi:hypothetical protein
MSRVYGWILLGLLLLAGGLGVWLWASSGEPAAGPSVGPSSSPSPVPPAYSVEVTLRRVKAIPVRGSVKARKLRAPAEEVRQTFTDLYAAAFVDPARWEGGAFPGIFDHFAPTARGEARQHLDDLTLGRAAEHVSAVRPEWARLDVRFLLGPARVPVAAQASMRFAATAFNEDGVEVPIRHRGDYMLERLEGRWLVTSYRVNGGFGLEAVG